MIPVLNRDEQPRPQQLAELAFPGYTVDMSAPLRERLNFINMATFISPEQRLKIVSSIKSENMSIHDAAKTFLITEDTIKKWIRKQTKNRDTSSTEVQRLKQQNQELKAIIGKMVHQQRMKKKS